PRLRRADTRPQPLSRGAHPQRVARRRGASSPVRRRGPRSGGRRAAAYDTLRVMDFIAGSWAGPATPDEVIEDRSPADLSMVLGRFPWAVAQVDRAVSAARAAHVAFAALPLHDRARLVRRIGAVLEEREEDLARAIALDIGKPLWEARLEAQACSAKAGITADEGLKLVADFPAPGQAGAECRFRALGVAAVLGPFNFPIHLPNGHILPALACGNAVVFKPSEIAPHAAEVYAKCVEEAGVPRGVFNLVQGGPPAGAALSAHPGVDAVLFTGSWGVGQAIQRANQGQTKLPALEKFEQGLRATDAECLLAPHRLRPRGLDGCYVSPSVHFVHQRRGTTYEREELFGPDLAVYPAASEEEALEIANSTDYGLAASVHTRSEQTFDRCQRALACGVVNWNAPTVGASGRLPFGGLRRSGNHRPAAL